jgi:hypothetical protein
VQVLVWVVIESSEDEILAWVRALRFAVIGNFLSIHVARDARMAGRASE